MNLKGFLLKYIILIGDGMADYPIDELGEKTPLQVAKTPNMDLLAQKGTIGLLKTIPDGFNPGSDIANLSILGYDPSRYYTGRSPLEAASIGVRLEPTDLAFRCNLVTLIQHDGKVFMGDYSAGHISTEEAKRLIQDLDRELSQEGVRFYPGVGYRHLMVWRGGPDGLETTPPHDISGKEVIDYLPKGEGSKRLIHLMTYSQMMLRDHPVNQGREENGLRPANSIWLWGQGRRPKMPTLKERFGIEGSVISAVDLMNGIGIYAGLKVTRVPGATGYIDTNYRGKAEYALKELEEMDFVCVHVEAPDEAGHQGDLKAKIRAIEDFDREIVGRVMDGIQRFKDYRLLVLTDHPTPIIKKTHTREPVPFVIYPFSGKGAEGFDEVNASSGVFIEEGWRLIERFFLG